MKTGDLIEGKVLAGLVRAMGLLCPCRQALVCLLAAVSLPIAAQSQFVAFESGPVRPLAISGDGSTLFATNISDNRLEIFDIAGDTLSPSVSVPVGLEPVAVAVLDDDVVFVANHLSDSVSVVSLSPVPRVVQTLLVGDEPRDLILADPDGNGPLAPRLFVTTAHRGQHRTHFSIADVPGAGDPLLTEPSIPRADVWVFDTADLGLEVGGVPLAIVELFADTPRALAVSPDQQTVYAAAHFSGNRSTIVRNSAVCNGFESAGPCIVDGISSPGGLANGIMPGGNPGPSANIEGITAPETGLIVQFDPDAGPQDDNADTGVFLDELGRNWNNAIRYRLPDKDVFAIDSQTLAVIAQHRTVGTTLFNMVTNPVSGNLYISNTEANNLQRFEGPGLLTGSTVQGNLAASRISVIPDPTTQGGAVQPRHLNKHIDYGVLPAPPGTSDASLSTPLDMVVSPDGELLYVAGYGSSAVAVYATTELEADSFAPSSDGLIDVSGGGPGGLAISPSGSRIYVYTRFDNGLSIVDTQARIEVAHINLFNPEPQSIREGRPILYDARATSSNGEASCASCHIFGDTDHIAWDLGNPDDFVKSDPVLTILGFASPQSVNGGAGIEEVHPMKGPMLTQTLRGLANAGAMHWRGDRANGVFGIDATDEDLSFRNFIEAFTGLLGRESEISDEQMQAFSDFQLQVLLPPNPVRALDNSMTPAQQRGFDFFHGSRLSDGVPLITTGPLQTRTGFTCNGCHEHDAAQGFFGTGKHQSFEGGPQIVKIPHFRNLYTRVGMFGMPGFAAFNPENIEFMGDQVRGYGFTHDGSVDTLKSFFSLNLFQSAGPNGPVGFISPSQHFDMEQLMLAFDTDLAPIVGQQVTLAIDNFDAAAGRVILMLQRAMTPFVSKSLGGGVTEADLIARTTVDGIPRGFVYSGAGSFQSDLNETYSSLELACLAYTDGPVTFTSVPPGSGTRIGIDRDLDGTFDGLEPDQFALLRTSTTPDPDTEDEIYQQCLALKQDRIDQHANFDCSSGQLTFPVAIEGVGNYQIGMAISNNNPIQFELTSVEAADVATDNLATYSNEDGLTLPVIRLSCANTVNNMRMQILPGDTVVFEVTSFGQ